jgi:hypothetical protein
MASNNYHELTALAVTAVDTALMDPEVSKTATIYCGTLFVTCNAYSAAKIQKQLIQDLKCFVRLNKVGPEYAFDFI